MHHLAKNAEGLHSRAALSIGTGLRLNALLGQGPATQRNGMQSMAGEKQRKTLLRLSRALRCEE